MTLTELAIWINTVLKAVGKALPASFSEQTQAQLKRTVHANQLDVAGAVRIIQQPPWRLMLPSELQLSSSEIEIVAHRAREWIAKGSVRKSREAQILLESDGHNIIERLADLSWSVSRPAVVDARPHLPVTMLRNCIFAVYDKAGAPIPPQTPGLDRQYEALLRKCLPADGVAGFSTRGTVTIAKLVEALCTQPWRGLLPKELRLPDAFEVDRGLIEIACRC